MIHSLKRFASAPSFAKRGLLAVLLWMLMALPMAAQTMSTGTDFSVNTMDAAAAGPIGSLDFTVNTLDVNSSGVANVAFSGLFVVNTLNVSNSGPVEGAFVFAVDTRAITPTITVGAGDLFTIDTRDSLPMGIFVQGPASIVSGGTADYRVFSQGSSGAPEDITLRSTIAFSGQPPEGTGIGGWTVFAGRVTTAAAMQVVGVLRNGAGRTFTAPLTVTIQPLFLLTAKASLSGSGAARVLAVQGTAGGGLGPYVFTWDTNADGTFGDVTGSAATQAFPRAPGTYRIRGRVTDANGLVAEAATTATVNAPPVANQPAHPNGAPDPLASGFQFNNPNGNPLQLLSGKANDGLVVITHGLNPSSGNNHTWMSTMANAIKDRCTAEGRVVPQIALYFWDSNPSAQDGIDDKAQAMIDDTEWVQAFDTDGAARAETAGMAATQGLTKLAELYYPTLKKELAPVFLVRDFAHAAANSWPYVYDLWQIKPDGLRAGARLAEMLRDAAKAGFINPSAPLHLIGHSAGGFVVGEAAYKLMKQPDVRGELFAANGQLLVTMLDTPFPEASHFRLVQNPSRIERYITQFGGALAGINYAPQLDTMDWIWSDFRVLDANTWYPKTGINFKVPRGIHYQRVQVPLRQSSSLTDVSTWVDGHTYAYVWYTETIRRRFTSLVGSGFDFSPVVGNRAFDPVPEKRRGTRDMPAGAPLPDVPLGLPTQTFGNATTVPGGMVILTESGEAGAIFDLTVPAAADSLEFSYEFSSPGDGDFLSVEIEGQGRVATGLDDEAGREGYATGSVSLRGYEDKPIRLIFRLVSRGATNAVVELSALRIQQTDDSDGDGLINSAELTAGTDPRNSDTDFDGLSDADEFSVYQTSPLAGDTDGDGIGDRSEVTAGTDPLQNGSFLRVTRVSRDGLAGAVTLEWPTVADRLYRVLRTRDLSLDTYEVVSTEIEGNGGAFQFTDPNPDPPGTAAFYWVECLPLN